MRRGRAEKPVVKPIIREVIYDRHRWEILQEKRNKAIGIMKALSETGLEYILHGSLARGDVDETSDLDIVSMYPIGTGIVETLLFKHGYDIVRRELIQATPYRVPKIVIYLDELTSISIPLTKLHKTEREFYKFGGEISLTELIRGARVPGVDKRLMLIEPTERGHIESSIIGREHYVAKKLGINIETVLERVRVLTRRDEIGRTGLYIKYVIPPDESVEHAIRKLAKRKVGLKKRLEENGYSW